MGNSFLVIISWLFGAGVVVIVAGVVVIGVMAATGDFGKTNECISEAAGAAGAPPRGVSSDSGAADQWDAKWKTFDTNLDGGQSTSVTFTESEVTARAQKFLDRKSAPVEDVVICFHDGSAEARGKVELPVLGGIPVIGGAFSTNVKIRGTMDLSGTHPQVVITDIEAGNLPGTAVDQVEDTVRDIINSRLDDLNLSHQYPSVTFTEGSVQIDGTP
jgi:hypothetical protein